MPAVWEEASSLAQEAKIKVFLEHDEEGFAIIKSLLNERYLYGPMSLILNVPFKTDSSIHPSQALPPSNKTANIN
jgi:hypothetical protein